MIAAAIGSQRRSQIRSVRLSLAGFEARIGLVDDVNAALAPHDAIVAMAFRQRFQ
jgi:hypothetical protein